MPRSPSLRLVMSMTCCLAGFGCGHNAPSTEELLARYPTPIYSLTGEPLNGGPLGRPKCEDAQTAWAARVDADHDGFIDLDELLDNARAQFAAMDLDHSGALTSDQLSVYRKPFALSPRTPPASTGTSADSDGATPDDSQSAPQSGAHRKKDPAADRPLGLRPPSSQPDPVLAADSNLDFKVTLDEYLAQQRESFTQLDKNKDHRLSADELAVLCHIRERAATR